MNVKKLPALLLVPALALAACGGDDGDSTETTGSTATTVEETTSTTGDEPTTSTTAGAAATTTPTTAAPATTATTVDGGGDSPAPGDLPTVPDQYANAFVEAWSTGNRDLAERLGTPAAVESIFSLEGGGSWGIEQCDGAAGSLYCTFTAGGSARIIVRVANEAASQGREQAVTEVRLEG